MMISRIARTAAFALLSGAAALALAGTAHAGGGPGYNPGGVYGNPVASAAYWQEQHFDDCALMSVAAPGEKGTMMLTVLRG